MHATRWDILILYPINSKNKYWFFLVTHREKINHLFIQEYLEKRLIAQNWFQTSWSVSKQYCKNVSFNVQFVEKIRIYDQKKDDIEDKEIT